MTHSRPNCFYRKLLHIFSSLAIMWLERLDCAFVLLISALTLSDKSTHTRIDLLEIDFCMLSIYAEPMEPVDGDPAWSAFLPRRSQRQFDSLYINVHIRDALNTFVALLDIMSNSDRRFCLNRIGSNPLEHAFGSARVKCREVQRVSYLINTFASNPTGGAAMHGLGIAARPRRRCSVGVGCLPLEPNQKPSSRRALLHCHVAAGSKCHSRYSS
jgi:hypothetical protein